MVRTRSNDALLIRDEDDIRNCDEACLRIGADISIEVATKRVFVVGHQSMLSNLYELDHTFGLRWNFFTSRSGKAIKCNRVSRKSKYSHQGVKEIYKYYLWLQMKYLLFGCY